MYTVIGARKSRAFRPLWLLEEMGIAYEHKPAPPRSKQAYAHSASGKIPLLIDGNTAISDSVAIMTYLADRHGQFTFPAGTIERAIQDGHTHFLLDEFDACLWAAARHSFVLPKERRVTGIKDSLKWEFERSVDQFVTRLGEGPYLMGKTMTIADIIAGHCGMWAGSANFPVENPAFRSYLKMLVSRPAYARTVAMD